MVEWLVLTVAAPVLYFLWRIVHWDGAMATKLLAGIPLTFLLSIDVMVLCRLNDEDWDNDAFWTPGGFRPPLLKTADPVAKYVIGFWISLSLIWFGALDEVFRHDFSNLFARLAQ